VYSGQPDRCEHEAGDADHGCHVPDHHGAKDSALEAVEPALENAESALEHAESALAMPNRPSTVPRNSRSSPN
jgi:hypothetical protein